MPTTHTVNCDAGEKIQDKIALARPGDTILCSGNCSENVAVSADVVLVTIDGQGKTTITAPAKGDGFFVRGREITIKGFTITGGRDGIHLSGSASGASANVVNNTIRKTGRHGIHLDHTSVGRIAGNTIEEAKVCGIDVAEMSVARVGYLLRPMGHGPNVVGNTVENNKGSGILVTRNSQADVFGNAISGNGGDGITTSHMAGVNTTNEDKLFDLGPNSTAAKNGGYGLSGSVGGYVDGPFGTLDGAKGAKKIDSNCIDRLT